MRVVTAPKFSLVWFAACASAERFYNMMDSDTNSRVSSRNSQILPSQPSKSPPPHVLGTSETRRDESTKFAEFFEHTHVNDAPIGPVNENDENDEKGGRKRKQEGGGTGKSN